MAPSFSSFLLVLSAIIITKSIDPYGTCDEPFIIFKHTVATSDSYRDCSNLWSVFPDISQEEADKFRQGYCAYQCKMELPYSCFKIHAPQTEQFPQGLLDIDVFESKLTEKWTVALSAETEIKYDTFFDFNMAFWVKSLDTFIRHWQYAASNNDLQLNYFGIEWTLPDDLSIEITDPSYQNNKFYSILLQLPDSQSQFEFISYARPSLKFYTSMKWYTDSVPRATFRLQSAPYPWDREDEAEIMPIRISRATSNLEDMYGFYTNVMEAELLYSSESINDASESYTKSIFMELQDTHIELQFIERGDDYRNSEFTLTQFEDLMMGTHEVISSPYCGQDRWMDNVWAYSTYTIPGLMDKVFDNLVDAGIKFKVGKNVPEHTSEHTKYLLDLIGYDGDYTFGLWVVEPGGHAFKVGGIISDPDVAELASFGDPQWCAHECENDLVPGQIDMTLKYEDESMYNDDLGYDIIDQLTNKNYVSSKYSGIFRKMWFGHERMKIGIIIGICVILSLFIGYFRCYFTISIFMSMWEYYRGQQKEKDDEGMRRSIINVHEYDMLIDRELANNHNSYSSFEEQYIH